MFAKRIAKTEKVSGGNMRLRRALSKILMFLFYASASQVLAKSDALTVMVFAGVQNLPIIAAQEQGYFRRQNIEVDVRIAPNSLELRNGLAEGRYQIVHTSVDNAVAMAEQSGVDILVFLGGDNGFNNLYVQPNIAKISDLRGKTVTVDAPDTAFAIMLYRMLELNGLKKGDYQVKPVGATRFRLDGLVNDKSHSAALLNLPFSIQAERAGLRDLGIAVNSVGPYLSTTGFTLRSWAPTNRGLLERYTQAYVEGLRWTLNQANKKTAIEYLSKRLSLSDDISQRSYEIATDPNTGFDVDGRVNLAGFRNVLKLRAEILGTWGGKPPEPSKYLDLSYWEEALKRLDSGHRGN